MDDLNWNVDILAPIVSGSLSIRDIVPDSFLISGHENQISLVYSNELYSFSIDSFIQLNDTNFSYQAYLQKIKINPVTISQSISLGQIIDDAGLSGLIQDGAFLPIPPFSGISSDNIIIDGTPYFQTMTLLEGFLDLRITNTLPFSITNLIFELKNFGENEYLVRDTFEFIPVGSEIYVTYSLENKTVKGNLTGKILNLDTPGSNGTSVNIHYSDAIETQVTVRNLKPSSATAIFPAQDLLDKGDRIYFRMGTVALDRIKVKSGQVRIDAYNTLEDPMHYTYSFPGATLNGDTFKVSGVVAPAVNGVASVLHTIYNLEGYNLDLRGAGPIEHFYNQDLNGNGFLDQDTINTAFVLAKGSIDSTGHLISLSLQDSFVFHSYLEGLIPEYAHGYLGQDTIKADGEVVIDMFQGIQSSQLQLSEIKVDFVIKNPIGSGAGVYLNDIQAINSKENKHKSLILANGLNPFFIAKPIEPIPGFQVDPVEQKLSLNNTNSNALDLINLLPDKFFYSLDFYINPQFSPPPIGLGTDFVYNNNRAVASMQLEIPLSVIASNLNLSDTVDINLNSNNIETLNQGTLFLISENDFPFEAMLEIEMLDEFNLLTGTLLSDGFVQAAEINTFTGRTIASKRSRIEIPLSENDINLLKSTKKLIVNAAFNTLPTSEVVKLFDDYRIKFRITSNVNIDLGGQSN